MDAAVAPSWPQPDPCPPTPPPANARWRRLLHPYFLVSTAFVALAVLLAIQRPWGVDFWVHATAVGRLSHNLLNPGGLQVAGMSVDSSYYSPYTVLLAMIAQTANLSPVTTLSAMAPVSAALLCFGFYRFSRVFSTGRWFAVMAAGIAVALWGSTMWAWSGLMNVFGLPIILPLPSTVATALMLLAWALLVRAIAAPRLWRWLALAAIATLIVLIHPLTAAATAVGATALLIWRLSDIRPTAWRGLAVATVLSGVLALTWPYYSVLDLFGSHAIDESNQWLYRQPWRYEGMIVLAVPALWLRWRRCRRDSLVWMAGLSLAVIAIGAVTGNHAYIRLLAITMLAAQLALAAELYACRPWKDLLTRAWTAVTATACAAVVVLNSGNLLYALPPSQFLSSVQYQLGRNPLPPDYSWLAGHAAPGDVVITDDLLTRRVITGYGLYTVSPGWQDPVVPDSGQRAADEIDFFDLTTTSLAKRHILERWSVDWILIVSPESVFDTSLGLTPRTATGPDGQRLYAVARQ